VLHCRTACKLLLVIMICLRLMFRLFWSASFFFEFHSPPFLVACDYTHQAEVATPPAAAVLHLHRASDDAHHSARVQSWSLAFC
jgi:hypothetical protein